MRAEGAPPAVNRTAPAFGRKAVLYATCFVNYNSPSTAWRRRAVLALHGVETEVVYPALLRHAAAGGRATSPRWPRAARQVADDARRLDRQGLRRRRAGRRPAA